MKIKRHFFFVIVSEKISRTYGGSDYKLAVYENKGRGRFVYLGEREGCTRAHHGYESEAWSVVWDKLPKRTRDEITSHEASGNNNYAAYYTYRIEEFFGIKLQRLN